MTERLKIRLERLTEVVESYMVQWSSRDSYNDFRMLLSVYVTLCHATKREPEDSLVLQHKLEEWILQQKKLRKEE